MPYSLANQTFIAARPATRANDASAATCFNRAVYNELAEILGPEDTILVIDVFMTETGRQIDFMRHAAKRSDTSAVKREAHAIKSSSASLGFIEVGELAKAIESEALGLNWPALDARLAALSSAFTEARAFAIHHRLYHPANAAQKLSGANRG